MIKTHFFTEERESGDNDKDIKEECMEVEEVKLDTSIKCEEGRSTADVINVSEGFHLRTYYKRKIKTSKLDGLLERRVKQFTLEEKQRLERLKLKASASSSGFKSLNPQKTIADLQRPKAGDGKQVDLTLQNRSCVSSTNPAESPIQGHLSRNLHFTKTSEPAQSLPCLNRLLEGEADITSVPYPETQNLVAKNTKGENDSEPMDTCQIQEESKERVSNNSILLDSKPTENKEANKCDIFKANAKCSELTKTAESECERIIQPITTESNCEGDASSSAKEGNEKQDFYSVETCTLEERPEELSLQGNVRDSSQANSEDAAENKMVLNQKQTLGGLKSLHTELSSGKVFGTQVPDTIGANIVDEVVTSKVTEANGDKQDQEKNSPPSSTNKCLDQIQSIADRNNNKNGELAAQTEKEKSATFEINGKDTGFKLLPNEECLQRELRPQTESNMDSKVNNANKSNAVIKPFSSNEPVKPFMNGDIAMEDTNEKNNLDSELYVPSSVDAVCNSGENDLPQEGVAQFVQNTGRKQISPERASPVDDISMPSLHSCNENDTYSETKCMEIESPCAKKVALSPVISCEESSLSNDFADQNGLQTINKAENINGENTVKAVVTEVTTSTTSTESRTIYTEVSAIKDDKESMVSSTENCSIATVTTTTTKTVTKLTTPTTDSISVKEHSKTLVTTTVTDSFTTPGGTLVTSMTVSKEYSTKDKVKLMKFSRPKKTRSGTALPSYRKFVTKSSKKSIFVLPNDDLKKLARRGGIREVPCFNYTAKPALDIWPYPSPRPTFGITWRYAYDSL